MAGDTIGILEHHACKPSGTRQNQILLARDELLAQDEARIPAEPALAWPLPLFDNQPSPVVPGGGGDVAKVGSLGGTWSG